MVVKSSPPPGQPGSNSFEDERYLYGFEEIRQSPHIRSFLDFIDPANASENKVTNHIDGSVDPQVPCLIFEWMDHTLWRLPSAPYRSNSVLPRIIARSVLSALALLKRDFDAIHADINPNNILLSKVEGLAPSVKVGDLGCVVSEGFNDVRIQSLETRAPEVWQGRGCWHTSDVWSLGVSLAHWLASRTIFGPKNKRVEGLTEAWCMAKLQRLVGEIDAPEANAGYKRDWLQAREIMSISDPDTDGKTLLVPKETLRQILEALPDTKPSAELLDFIDSLLVIDYTKRPTAEEALSHPYLDSDSTPEERP